MKKIGVSWNLIRDFFANGILRAEEVELVEISFADFNFLKRKDLLEHMRRLREDYELDYTVHAPHQVSKNGLRVDLGRGEDFDLKIMEKTVECAYSLGAKGIVLHGGDYHGTASINRSIKCLRKISRHCSNLGIYLALENLFTIPEAVRIGEFPEDLLYILKMVNDENLHIALDVGHAYISSERFEIPLLDYFEKLESFTIHYHLHNNFGISSEPWDKHLPLTTGKINYPPFLKDLKGNVILEVRDGGERDIIESLKMLGLKKLELACVL